MSLLTPIENNSIISRTDLSKNDVSVINENEVDIFQVANKALKNLTEKSGQIYKLTSKFTKISLASGMAILTSTLLSFTVELTRLTGCFIFPIYIIGTLSKPLHNLNKSFAKYSVKPLNVWALSLYEENKRITETEKIFRLNNKKVIFNKLNYKNRFKDGLNDITAVVVVALSVINATLWLISKPLYVALIVPGLFTDAVLLGSMEFNERLSHVTFSCLENLTKKMVDRQTKLVVSVAEPVFEEIFKCFKELCCCCLRH